MTRRYFSLAEFSEYTSIGMTKCREIAKAHETEFVVRVGKKIFIDIVLFDEYVSRCREFGLSIG